MAFFNLTYQFNKIELEQLIFISNKLKDTPIRKY